MLAKGTRDWNSCTAVEYHVFQQHILAVLKDAQLRTLAVYSVALQSHEERS